MTDTAGNPQSSRVLSFLFHLLLLWYPLLSLLWRRDYPLLTAEGAVLLAVAASIAALLALAGNPLRGRGMLLFTPLLIALVMMVQFNFGIPVLVAATLLAAALQYFLGARFYMAALPVMAALLLGAWLDSRSAGASPQQAMVAPAPNVTLPPIVHILLDSFGGIDGLPDYQATPLFRDGLYRFLEEYGFETFPRAYSRHTNTGESMYAALNFRNDWQSNFLLETLSGEEHRLSANALFDAFAALGYRFNIYQTEHLDYCQSHRERVDLCWTYDQPNVLSIRAAPGALQRAEMLSKILLMQSSALTTALRKVIEDPSVAVHDPTVLQRLAEDLVDAPRGRVFLAHVLLPHSPFVFLHHCEIDYATQPALRWASIPGEAVLKPEIHEFRAMRYFEQTDCALLSLRALFDRMQAAGTLEGSIILLHGDHGPGLATTGQANPAMPTEAVRARHSVLFAARFPGGGFAVDERTLALSELLEGFARAVQGAASNVPGPSVGAAITPGAAVQTPYVFMDGPPPKKRIEGDFFAP